MHEGSGPRTVYRVVRSVAPTVTEFQSRKALGLPAPEDPRLWDGISVYDRAGAAERQARRFPRLGGYIATLYLQQGERIRVQKTLANRNHYTLWGDPEDLLGCVVEVSAVEADDVEGE